MTLGPSYGGLPPEGPTFNPRKGSCTGSYALPVPPQWLRSKEYEANKRKRAGSINKQYLLNGNSSKSRSGSVEMLPGWLGAVLEGKLGPNPTNINASNSQKPLKKDENTPKTSITHSYLNKDILPEVIIVF